MNFISRLFSPFTRLLSGPARFLGVSQRLLGLSLPARVALVLAVFLVLCIFGYCGLILYRENWNGLWDRTQLRYSFPVALLLIGLPLAAYWTTKYWIEVEPTDFPDIDAAWHSGLDVLAKAGINLCETPLYFGIGVHDATTASTLMSATGWELVVDGKPDGAAPLRWYATRDAVIVFCLDASGLSLCHAPQRESAIAGIGKTIASGGGGNIRATMVAGGMSGGGDGGNADPNPRRGAGIRGTMIADAPEPTPNRPAVGIRGTMIAGASMSAQSSNLGSSEPVTATLDRVQLGEQEQRLKRVCQLAKQSRQPYCTINGVLAFIHWKLLATTQPTSLPMTLREDTLTILDETGIHAPLLLVVSGMESEIGFTELVRRVGEDRAQANRFGQSFNHQGSPTQQQMIALATNATGAFEGWIYDLFRQPDCLSRTNNDKLFAMLCRIRSIVHPRLTDVLVGYSETITPERPRSLLLGGCYFAATGSGKIRQAFVKSVMTKMVEMQEELQWTDDSWRAETRYHNLVQLLLLVNGLLIVFIISVFVYKIMT